MADRPTFIWGRIFKATFLVAAVFLLVSCGGGGGSAGGSGASLVSVAVTPPSGRIFIGSTVQMSAIGTYSDSSTADISAGVTWSSSNASVASISANGLASGVSAGTATITAVYGIVSGSSDITVGIGTASKIAAGGAHSLAIDGNGALWSWGYNNYGELGDGTNVNSNIPIRVGGISGVTGIAGGEGHTLAVDSSGSVWSWGANLAGQLGNGTSDYTNAPGPVSALTGVSAVAAGGWHSLALKSDGTVWCWGYNYDGQAGNGNNSNQVTPVAAAGLTGVTAVSGGYVHSLALKSDGTVWVWGNDYNGQLGDNLASFINGANVPQQVSGLTGVVMIAAGGYHNVVLKSDGTLWAWGLNREGQLGDGTTTLRAAPVQVAGSLTGITAIAAGKFHTMALKSDGTVWAWGFNYQGQLGNGTSVNSSIPVQVSGLSGAVAIAAGGGYMNYETGENEHSMALKSDGTVWTWGYNAFGALGDGTNATSYVPVEASGF